MWYYYMTLVMLVISLVANIYVKSTFNKHLNTRSYSGLTGSDAAIRILKANGITDVRIQVIAGELSDNYNPTNKTLNLSQSVAHSSSISSISVAAHECGHAIQHAVGYKPVNLRKTLVPIANFTSYLSYIAITIGMIMENSQFVKFGALLFSGIVLFHLVTLPVEIDASRRALVEVKDLGILDSSKLPSGRKVLTAAAFTYFVALLSSILQLLRLLSIASNTSHRRR